MRRSPEVCVSLLYIVLVVSVLRTAASAKGSQQHSGCSASSTSSSPDSAVCSLQIYGRGYDSKGKLQTGIERVRLNCTSPTGSKVVVGVASVIPSSPLVGLADAVRQQLLQYGSGIELSQPSCQQAVEAPSIQANLVPLFGLLYFCEGAVTLVRPVVKDLALPYTIVSRGQDDTAAVVVAGNARVTVLGAVVEHVDASTAFAVLQVGHMTIDESSFRHNQGNPGSAVFAHGQSAVCIQSSSFHNSSSSDFGGAIAVMGSSNTSVVNSNFTNCRAASNGGAIYSIERSSLAISNSSITRSTAGTLASPTARGGAVYSSGLFLRISEGSKLTGNAAYGNGGGLYVTADFGAETLVQSELELTDDVVITGNRAAGSNEGQPSAGGGVYINLNVTFDPELLRAVVTGNTALRDKDVGTNPAELTFLGNSTVEGYAARPDAQSGLSVVVALRGEGGFPCTGRNIEAHWTSSAGNTSSTPRRRLAAIAEAALVTTMGTASPRLPVVFGAAPRATATTDEEGVARMLLKFQEPPGAHSILFKVAGISSNTLSATITVHVRQCWQGETEEAPGLCRMCPKGSYNFAPGECLACPAHAECPGGAVVLSKPGFWQSSPQHNKVHRCPNSNACSADRTAMLVNCSDSESTTAGTSNTSSSCTQTIGLSLRQQDSSFAQQQCRDGYLGHLCGMCAAGFGSVRLFNCKRCYSRGVVVLVYILSCLLLLALMKLLIWLTLRENSKVLESGAGDVSSSTVEPAQLLRQLVLFSQYTLIVASVQAADSWPVTISKPLQALSWIWAPATPHTLAPECLLHQTGAAASNGVARVVFYVAVPLVLLAVMLCAEGLVRCALARGMCRGRRLLARHRPKGRLIAASIVVVFFFLPSIVRSAFGLFACITIDQPAAPPNNPMAIGSFWLHNTNQQCFQGWHTGFALGLGIPLLLFVCFVPGFILYITLHHRVDSGLELDELAWLQQYGFLVRDYKPQYRFWEAVVSAQTIVLVALSVFSYSLGPYYQAMLINIAVAVIWLLLALVKPLAHAVAHRVALVSMGCLYLTSYSALAFSQMAGSHNLSLSASEAAAIPLFMGVVVVAANVSFVAWVLWKLVRLIDWAAQWQLVCDKASHVCALVANMLCPGCMQPSRGLPSRVQDSAYLPERCTGQVQEHAGRPGRMVVQHVELVPDAIVKLPADQDQDQLEADKSSKN